MRIQATIFNSREPGVGMGSESPVFARNSSLSGGFSDDLPGGRVKPPALGVAIEIFLFGSEQKPQGQLQYCSWLFVYGCCGDQSTTRHEVILRLTDHVAKPKDYTINAEASAHRKGEGGG